MIMAELNLSEEPISANYGAFKAVFEAMASNDKERKIDAVNDAITAVGCVGSMLNVVADYIYLRAQHPKDSLYATDFNVADAVYSLSDLLSVQQTALIEAGNARFELRVNPEKTIESTSKEG